MTITAPRARRALATRAHAPLTTNATPGTLAALTRLRATLNLLILLSHDIILINSSAGKDSQATLTHVVAMADAAGVPRWRIVVVHADLREVEWDGTRELAATQAEFYGLRFEVVRRELGGLLDQIEQRRKFPSSAARYCTSDQKTSQVAKLITRLVAEHRRANPRTLFRRVRILNCLGIRAAESHARAKRSPLAADPANWTKPPITPRKATKTRAAHPGRTGVPHGKREVTRWLPIFTWTDQQVWHTIRASDLPYHPAYDLGMPRLSCVFCVLAGTEELILAARHNPALAQRYVDLEQRIGHDFKHGLPMAEIVRRARLADDAEPQSSQPQAA